MTRATLIPILIVITLLLYGTATSITIWRAERASVSQAEWDATQARLAALEAVWNATVATETGGPSAARGTPGAATTISVNQVDQNLLEELPGIGPVRAMAILEARAAGPFSGLDDFRRRVPEIPKSVFEDISTKITFEH